MKELELPKIDKGEVVRPVETQKIVQHLKPKRGHKVWELNLAEKVIREAEIEKTNYEVGKGTVRKVLMKENCIYCTALNPKNADKKFMKMLLIHKLLTQ